MYNLKQIFMKKFYSLVAVLAVSAMAANAQITYPHTWDFTKWSDETVANLKADKEKGWTDVEKVDADPYEPTPISKDNCFWQIAEGSTVDANGNILADGKIVKELEGLKFTDTPSRSLAIAIDYQTIDESKDFGPYKGKSYLWFGGKKKDYFIIPNVPGGSKIKIGIESHKTTAARGVELYAGAGHDAANKIAGPAVPSTYQEQEWTVPAGDATDVQLYNTDGCHLYFIAVGDGAKVPEVGGVETITIAEDENAPIYNLQGVQVDENYKGVVIKNGKKYINR